MRPLRVVFDTNIYVMAAGMPGGYIDSWLELATPPDGKFQLYTTPVILAEVQEKLEQKLSFERALVVEYIDRLSLIATVVRPTQQLDVVKDDPDDNIILECAQEVAADIVVSADKHLTRLKKFGTAQIHHPTNLRYIFSYLDSQ